MTLPTFNVLNVHEYCLFIYEPAPKWFLSMSRTEVLVAILTTNSDNAACIVCFAFKFHLVYLRVI